MLDAGISYKFPYCDVNYLNYWFQCRKFEILCPKATAFNGLCAVFCRLGLKILLCIYQREVFLFLWSEEIASWQRQNKKTSTLVINWSNFLFEKNTWSWMCLMDVGYKTLILVLSFSSYSPLLHSFHHVLFLDLPSTLSIFLPPICLLLSYLPVVSFTPHPLLLNPFPLFWPNLTNS